MHDPEDRSEADTADRPTRLQRAARRGCAGLAYTVVLVPLVLVIYFFSSIPRGWEQFGGMAWNILFVEQGAHTQITIFNDSGHDVQITLMQFDDTPVIFSRPLKYRRHNDAKQKSVHQVIIYFQEIKPFDIPVRVSYHELDTGREHSAEFVVDLRPTERCRFVVSLEESGPRISECLRSEVEDFGSP